MNQYTAVIDIGSNSVRLVIYEPLNQHEFQLVYEKKFKVRIGEGAYLENGYLQKKSMARAYSALHEFTQTLKKYPLTNTLCVATSALRDAPNKLEFTKWIQKELQLTIDIIDGKEEAKLGAMAALHLLPISNGISVDIGGGSADIALIQDSKITDTHSLNLGTVRLKELFTQERQSRTNIHDYIQNELASLPKHFQSPFAIGIGGTARTLSKAIMAFQGDSSDSIHNFNYNTKRYKEFFDKIVNSSDELLKELKVSKTRIDTIREGTLIWQAILKEIGTKEVISSAVGLREGLFLEYVFKENLEKGVKFTPFNS